MTASSLDGPSPPASAGREWPPRTRPPDAQGRDGTTAEAQYGRAAGTLRRLPSLGRGGQAEFNDVRPHEALGGAVPASLYVPSARPMPAVLPEPEYPAHFEARYVSRCGAFKFKRRQIFLSQALCEEWIAFEEVADGVWSLYFYDVLLGRLDERDFKLRT